MMRSFMQLATLQFATRLQKYIGMGIDILKIFISGGMSFGIIFMFGNVIYGSACVPP